MITGYSGTSSYSVGSYAKQIMDTGNITQKVSAAAQSKSEKSTLGPATQINISDRTKRLLQEHQDGQSALAKVQSVLSKLKGQVNDASVKPSTIGSDNTEFSQPQPLAMNMLSEVDRQIMQQHTSKDGSISSYNVIVKDISMVPTTKAEKDYWYSSDGADMVAGVSNDNSADYKEMVQAIRDKKINFIDARSVSDLNYHNTATFQGGEGGSAPGLTRTYNTYSSIFKDPSKGYYPMADGTLLSWDRASPRT